MRIDYLSAPSGRFVARESAAVTNADRCPNRGGIWPVVNSAFASVIFLPSEGGTGSAEPPAAATAVAQHVPSQRADSAAITDRLVSAPSPPGDPAPPIALPPSGRISTRTHRRTAASAARLLLIMGSGPAGPLPHPQGVLTPRRESHGRDRLWSSLQPLLLPPRLPRPYPFHPAATAPSMWEPLIQDFRPPLTSRPPLRFT